MIEDEYKRLLKMLDEGEKLEDIQLEDLLKEAVAFFEELRKTFPTAAKEEREVMISMMSHLHSKLQEISKRAAVASGMTEEELTAYSENPSNFTPEQWQKVQESKQKLYQSARKFSSSVEAERRKKAPDTEGVKTPPSKPRTRRPKRKDWMKS